MFVIFTVFGALNIPIGTFVNASDAMFGGSCGFGAAPQAPMTRVIGWRRRRPRNQRGAEHGRDGDCAVDEARAGRAHHVLTSVRSHRASERARSRRTVGSCTARRSR